MVSKKEVEILISKLEDFNSPNPKLEQYSTPSEIASEMVWIAYLNKNIENQIIADLGCGTGILGICALLLGAKKVYFVDISKKVLIQAQKNLKYLELETKKKFNAEFLNLNVEEFNKEIDTILENPPFGVQNKNADRIFIEVALKKSKYSYILTNSKTDNFIDNLLKNNKYKKIKQFEFTLKKTMFFHKKNKYHIDVSLWFVENDKK